MLSLKQAKINGLTKFEFLIWVFKWTRKKLLSSSSQDTFSLSKELPLCPFNWPSPNRKAQPSVRTRTRPISSNRRRRRRKRTSSIRANNEISTEVPEVRVKGHTQQVPPPHLKFMYTIILPCPAQPSPGPLATPGHIVHILLAPISDHSHVRSAETAAGAAAKYRELRRQQRTH